MARLMASGSAITLGKSGDNSVCTRMPSSRPLNMVSALSTRAVQAGRLRMRSGETRQHREFVDQCAYRFDGVANGFGAARITFSEASSGGVPRVR